MEKVRKELVGTVVSAKNNKTITVLVETYKKHPLYGKRVKYSKKYAAHDESNKAKVEMFSFRNWSCFNYSNCISYFSFITFIMSCIFLRIFNSFSI